MHALQDSKTVFILMASFTSPPRKIPGVGEPANGNDSVSYNQEDDPPITHSLKFDKLEVPSPRGSELPKPSYDTRPFTPTYQKPFPEDITPWGQATIEEETWSKFLDAVKDRGFDLGKKVRAVQNYIDVGVTSQKRWSPADNGRNASSPPSLSPLPASRLASGALAVRSG